MRVPVASKPTVKFTYLSRKPHPSAGVVTMFFIALMSIITVLTWNNPELAQRWRASGQTIFESFELHRIWLSIFIHSDFSHFLSNAYMFGILGFLVSGYFGARILAFHVLALGPLVHVLTLGGYPPELGLVGISGVVYLLAGFWLIVYVGIDRRFSVSSRIVRAIGVGLVILFPTTFEPNVSYRAHAIGFGIGLAFGLVYFFIRRSEFRRFEIVEVEPEENIPPHLFN